MARRRKVSQPEEDFPITPMIDMVFLLLVFFMTVSTLAQADKRVELALPEAEESEVPDDLSDRGTVSIDAAGTIFLAARARSLEAMKSTLRASLERNPELRVQVRADRATPYEDIREVLKACAEVGAREVIYATHQAK